MSNSNDSIARIKAAEAVQKGDLITVGEDGLGRFAVEPGLEDSELRPLCQLESATALNESEENYFIGIDAAPSDGQNALAATRMRDGYYAIAFVAAGRAQVSIFDKSGTLMSNNELGLLAPGNTNIAVTALKSGNLAVAFTTGEAAELQVAVLSSGGDVLRSAHSVINGAGAKSVSIAALRAGGFVVAYAGGANLQPTVARFDATGQYLSSVMPENRVSSPLPTGDQFVAVAGLENGGFALAYSVMENETGYVFAVTFSAAGERLTPPMAVGQNITGMESVSPYVCIAALAKGGFAVGSYGGTAPGYQLTVFNSKGVVQGSSILLEPANPEVQAGPARMSVAGLSNGNAAVAWAGVFACGAVYAADGSVVFQRAGYMQAGGAIAVAPFGNGAVVAAVGIPDTEGVARLHAGFVGSNMYGQVTESDLVVTRPLSRPVVLAVDSPDETMIAGVCNDHVQLSRIVTYDIKQQTLVGVATQDTKAEELIPVQTAGVARLRVSFKKPYAADFNNNPTPGQKFTVIGDLVTLKGIQQ